MLKILNNLGPFFEDCYRRISVREYANLIKISPPTASKLLKAYHKHGLIHKHEERRHIFFYLNNENKDAIDLCRIYWRKKLHSISTALQKTFLNPTAILFGSAAKAELKADSDIDIALFTRGRKILSLKQHEKQLKRGISVYHFRSLQDIKNKHLRNNILNGYVLFGKLRWE